MTRHVELLRAAFFRASCPARSRTQLGYFGERTEKGEGKRRRQRGLKSAKAFDNFDLGRAPCERDLEVIVEQN